MDHLLDSLKNASVIVDYEAAPPADGDKQGRLTVWVDAMMTDETLSALLQAIVDRSVETGSCWDLRVGVVIERGRVSPRQKRILHAADGRRR